MFVCSIVALPLGKCKALRHGKASTCPNRKIRVNPTTQASGEAGYSERAGHAQARAVDRNSIVKELEDCVKEEAHLKELFSTLEPHLERWLEQTLKRWGVM